MNMQLLQVARSTGAGLQVARSTGAGLQVARSTGVGFSVRLDAHPWHLTGLEVQRGRN